MTRITLALLLTVLGAMPKLAQALTVPAGKAGIIEAVIGKVEVNVASVIKPAKVGQALDFGSTLSTGINGRLSVRHADNAVTRLAPNTELTLKAPGAKKGIFLGLSKGFIRFLVGKRPAGESFEVQTSNAVAAVKGTDAGVETDGKTTKSSVYESDRKKAMDFISEKFGKTQTLEPGQTMTLDEKGFSVRELTGEERGAVQDMFKALPEPVLQSDGGEDKEGEGDQGNGGEAPAETDPEAFADAINDAVAGVMEDLQLDNFLERDDRTGDLIAGRIVYDRNGDRTQVSSYITRPSENSVFKANYSTRLSGPFTGQTSAEEITMWNRPLEGDWTVIAKRALDDASNLDSNGFPIYYRTYQNFKAANPQGDTLKIETYYEMPLYTALSDGMGGWYAGPIHSDQALNRTLYTNDLNVFNIQIAYSYQYDMNDNPLAEYTDYYGSWFTYVNPTGDGGVRLELDDTYENIFLTTDFRVLDNAGTVFDLTDFAYEGQSTGLLFQDFKGLDNALNLEVTFNASNFSAPIDLVFIPELFDSMDILGLPIPDWPYYMP